MKKFVERGLVGVAMLLMSACVMVDGGSGGRWQEIAATEADFEGDRDTINVPRGDGPYRQLQLVVSGGDLEMRELVIYFANGQSYRPNIRHSFSNQSRPLVIDLPGDFRNVTRIDYNYRSTNKRGGKARVVVYGR